MIVITLYIRLVPESRGLPGKRAEILLNAGRGTVRANVPLGAAHPDERRIFTTEARRPRRKLFVVCP